MSSSKTDPASSPDRGRSSESRRRGRLGLRLTLLLAVLMTVAGAVSAYLSGRVIRGELLVQAETAALRVADTIKRSTRQDMLNVQREDVAETVLHLGGQPGIEHVRIYNKSGTIVYSSRPEEVDQEVDLTAEACNQCHAVAEPLTHLDLPSRTRIYDKQDGHRALAAIDVIYNEPSCSATGCHSSPEEQSVLGVIDVGMRLTAIDDRIAEASTASMAFALIATVIVCALIGLFIYSFVTRPLRSLLFGVNLVSEGDLESVLPVRTSDELGQLTESFNHMTADLRAARSELEEWARTLEIQVEERTRDLRMAQAQVVRAEKLSSIGTLAAGVAHELNSPLTGILTFSHLLLQDAQPGSREAEDLKVIVDETQRCASIIRQLLQFSREGEGPRRPEDLAEVITRALNLVGRQSMFHQVQVHTEFAPDVPLVSCHANQLQQVFLNMLINAAQAMPKGGDLTVRLRSPRPDLVEVQFEDTGSGIPEAFLGKLFDPFFTSKEVGLGTGLGLSVSYGIVRRHGGNIAVKSRLEVGTVFTITLPVAAAQELAK